MSTLIETVDTQGNISFSVGEAVDIRFVEVDDLGTVDVSAMTRVFHIAGVASIPVVVDPSNATGGQILIPTETLSLIGGSARFQLTDEDGPSPMVLWEGFINRRT